MNPTKRIQLVQIAKRKLCLSDEDYRAILLQHGGVESAKELVKDDRAFDQVMTRFRQLGFVSDKRQAGFGPNDRIGMATAGQIALIRDLWAEVTNYGSAQALDKWLSRFGPSALRFVDDKTAPKIIGALTAWRARKKARVGGSTGETSEAPLTPS